ncbi:MAG: hypothetical protein JWM27_1099 [Gemmatimonadetes bacterium]|nr:hypothetical protein [Gemmatimonadota bacterium]
MPSRPEHPGARAERELPLRITVLGPPPGVAFAVQRGRDELLPPTRTTAAEVSFDFTVRVAPSSTDGAPNFLGPFAQGTPADRFVYVNSGQRAGDRNSPCDRRAKVRLAGITWEAIDRVAAEPGSVLEARIVGTARDGGPVCASTPLLGGGWVFG